MKSHRKLIVSALFAVLPLNATTASLAHATGSMATTTPKTTEARNDCARFLKRNRISDVRSCDVSDAGVFGNVDGEAYTYTVYCIIPAYSSESGRCGDGSFPAQYHSQRGLAIMKGNEPFIERASTDIGLYVYEKPEIVTNSFGTLMQVSIRLDGTALGNESEYYIWREKTKKWELLDSTTWLKDLRTRIPPGLSINKGIWPDLETMRTSVGLYRSSDANCCPSGGTASITLGINENQIRIESVRFRAGSADH